MLAPCTGKVTEQNLGKDFETLLGMLRPEESVNKDDIKIIKEQIFGPNVFWVTETRATEDVLDGGILVCFVLCVKNIFLMDFLRVHFTRHWPYNRAVRLCKAATTVQHRLLPATLLTHVDM